METKIVTTVPSPEEMQHFALREREAWDNGWKVEVLPGVFWMSPRYKVPNAFHRLMHRLFFGVKYHRLGGE